MDLERLTCNLLNLPSTTDHRRLLGIPKDRFDEMAIDMALRRRLAQLRVHPMSGSSEVHQVRSYIQQIANDLKQASACTPRSPQTRSFQLTPLDQTILAVLIGEGGWNRRSRARLVAVAASYSISARGLMRILEALAAAARDGDGPLTVQRRATTLIDRSWTVVPAQKSPISIVDELITKTAKRFTPELQSPTPIMTIKLAVLFGALTLIAFILSLQVLLSSGDDHLVNNQIDTEHQRFIPASEPRVIEKIQHTSSFQDYPTFQLEMDFSSSINAADLAITLPVKLDDLAHSIRSAFQKGGPVDSTWIDTWKYAIQTASEGSNFIDSSLLLLINDQLINVMVQSEQDHEFASLLLHELQVPRIKLSSPVSIFQNMWHVGALARFSCDPQLSTITRTAARKLQLPSVLACDVGRVRVQSLTLSASHMIEITEYDQLILPLWENWIAAVKRIPKETTSAELFMQTIEQLLMTTVDLTRDSRTRMVLGRLVHEMNWTSGTFGRDSVVALYKDESVPTTDLILLGQLFLHSDSTTWFSTMQLLQPSNTMLERTNIALRLKSVWPVDSNIGTSIWNLAIPAGFNLEQVRIWQSRYRELKQVSTFDPESITLLRLLNEAAVAMWRGRVGLAEVAIAKLDHMDLFVQDGWRVKELRADGDWTKRIANARTDRNRVLELIADLTLEEITDLGPQDANTLASAALTNRSSRVTALATDVIIQKFPYGRNVAIALLNHLQDAHSKQQIIRLVASLTESILPDITDSRWSAAAHKALVQHALTVTLTQQRQLDAASNEISTSLIAEVLLLDPTFLPLTREIDATTAIKLLVDTWRQTVPRMYVPALTSEFNPTGVMQEYLLYQLEYLQLLQADEAHWRGFEPQVSDSKNSVGELDAPKDIVQQIMQVELAIASHWDTLIIELETEYHRQQDH